MSAAILEQPSIETDELTHYSKDLDCLDCRLGLDESDFEMGKCRDCQRRDQRAERARLVQEYGEVESSIVGG